MYGVITARPAAQRAHRDELQYLAGVAVSELVDIPEGMISRTVPAGLVALVIHRGPIRNIADTVRPLYREWLPQSHYRHSDAADVELYDRRFCPDGDESEMEYWITIEPR